MAKRKACKQLVSALAHRLKEPGNGLIRRHHRNRCLVRSADQIPDFKLELSDHAGEVLITEQKSMKGARQTMLRNSKLRAALTDVLTDICGVISAASDFYDHHGIGHSKSFPKALITTACSFMVA